MPILAIPVFLYKKGFNKFGMAIFGHSKFIPVFLEKLLENIYNGHFWPFQIYASLFGKNCQKIFRMGIFGHSKFIPVFLGKIVRKNLEWAFLVIPNLYQSFWEKLLENIYIGHLWPFQVYASLFGKNCQKIFRMGIFGHSKFIPVFLGKIVRKNLEWAFLVIPNLYQSFWEKLSEKIWNGHFWPFCIFSDIFLYISL